METIKKGFTPNTDIVCVIKSGRKYYYEVYISVSGYLRKCAEDGKVAHYVGKSDSNGELKLKTV